MAAEDRPAEQHIAFLVAAAATVRRAGLFPVVRGAEARAQNLPRVGHARRPSQSIADLTQTPSLAFPDSTLEKVELRAGRPRISGYWFGLTGPMGPLPTHLTEFASYERRYAKSQPFGDFLDLISLRMLQYFYRAWADSQPAAHADRITDDHFADWLGALSGATEGVGEQTSFPARARVHYAGLFASRRSAAAIEDGLSHLLRQPVKVREFQPRWRDIEPEDRSRLGSAFSTLGDDLVLGRRVRVASDAFKVVVRAKGFRDYEALLPSGPRFEIASEALDAFAPNHLEWDLTIEIAERDVRPAKLDGRTRLGWTAWVKPGATDRVRADTHLRKRRAASGAARGDQP